MKLYSYTQGVLNSNVCQTKGRELVHQGTSSCVFEDYGTYGTLAAAGARTHLIRRFPFQVQLQTMLSRQISSATTRHALRLQTTTRAFSAASVVRCCFPRPPSSTTAALCFYGD